MLKRKFGQPLDTKSSNIRSNIAAAAGRRVAGAGRPAFGRKGGISGSGFSGATQAGPATSPLAAKTAAGIAAKTKSGPTVGEFGRVGTPTVPPASGVAANALKAKEDAKKVK